MTRHPDAGVLAECREGLLGRRHAARVRAHLAGCPHCASLDAGLAEVSELLAGSPAPRMPDHLIARLDRALAAEAASRPQAGPDGAGGRAAGPVPGGEAARPDGEPGGSRRAGHGWRRGPRPATARHLARLRPATLGAAAAALIAVGGAAYGLAGLTGPQGGASSSAGRGAGGPGAPRHASALSPAGSQDAPQASRGAANGPGAGPAYQGLQSPVHVIGSGTDYQPGRFASQAASLLASPAYAGQAQRTATPAMQACVLRVTGRRTPEMVDVARYQGRPATSIVLGPSAGQPGKVWVTGAACSAQRRDILAEASLPSSG